MTYLFRRVLLLLAAVMFACGGDTPTQTMLVVSLDGDLDAETYETTVVITSAHPDSPQSSDAETVTRGAFPLCIAVVPFDDDASRTFSARVELRRGGVLVASREVETGFVAGEVRAVAIELSACTGGECGPPLRVDPATPFTSALCSGDGPDAGVIDSDTPDASCVDRPGRNCRVSEISDVDAPGFLRRGFFADGSLVLYGSSDDAVLAEVWPTYRTIGEYTIDEPDGKPIPLLVAGGGYIDDQSCIALATEEGPYTLINDTHIEASSNNHLVVCDGNDRVVERSGPSTGFAMGLHEDQPVFAYEGVIGDWSVTVRMEHLIGESAGAVSGLRVASDGARTCMSATFAGVWTTYNTNPSFQARYEATTGQNATLACSTGGHNPAQTYHFGGAGTEEVLSLFIDSPNVIAFVRHTDDLYVQIANGAPSSVSRSAGWTLVSLTPSSVDWSRTFNEESSAERLGDELVIARIGGAGDTTMLEWYSLEDDRGSTHELEGAWSIVATEDVAGTPQRLGLVAPADDAKARVILLSRE